jgi:phosphonate transport system substrate-binding protein
LVLAATSFATRAESASDKVHPFVVSGVVLNSGNARLVEHFVSLLSRRSGYAMKVHYVGSYSQLSETLRDRSDAVGWTCGAPFVEDHRAYGQQLVGVPLFRGKPEYHSLVMTRRDRPERRLRDFKGKVLAYSDPRSNSGFLAPALQLASEGTDIAQHFRLLVRAGTHERSIEALMGGLADVAAIDEYVWVEYVRANPVAGEVLREVERMGPFPFTPIVAGREVAAVDVERLTQALEGLTAEPEGRDVMAQFGLDGFVREPVEFYQPIATMLDSLAEQARAP